MKRCKRCDTEKDESAFSPYRKSKDGLFSWCKTCNCELQKGRYSRLTPEERKELNRHHRSPEAQKRSHDKEMVRYRSDPEYRAKHALAAAAYRYGITREDYAARRGRNCDICGTFKLEPGKRGSGMHIDHDHASDTLRGTLCGKCNRGLGLFDDREDLLMKAATYLSSWRKP